jgi:hypothetical protein
MKLVLEEKPFKGTWWKWALGLTVVQNLFWWVISWTVYPKGFTLLLAYRVGWVIWGSWIIFSWIPFVVGRLGLKTLMWCGLTGFLIGDLVYASLNFFEPVRRLYALLPFTGFVQANLTLLSLGVIIEFGRYVYRKVFEE